MKNILALCVCVLLISAGAAIAVDPVPYWSNTLDNDLAATALGGEIAGGPPSWASGFIGNAFGGTDSAYVRWDNLDVAAIFDPYDPNTNPDGGAGWDHSAGSTVDLYFSGDHWTTHSGDSGLWSVVDRYGGEDTFWIVQVQNGDIRIKYDNGPAHEALLTGVPLVNNTTYRLTVSQLGTNMKIYLDGGAYSNASPVHEDTDCPGTFSFPDWNDGIGGREMSVGTRSIFWTTYGGLLQSGEWVDEVRVYNGYYTPAEIGVPNPGTKCTVPIPADGAINIALSSDLSWKIPRDANEIWTYKVYVNDVNDFSAVTPVDVNGETSPIDPNYPLTRLTLANGDIPGGLSIGDIWWRVDAIDPNGPVVRTGDVWTFDAGATLAVLVSPSNTYDPQINIDEPILEWTSDPIVHHSRIIVTPAGESSIDCGVQPSPFDLYAFSVANPGLITMEWNKRYEWQVIEEDSGNNPLAVGNAWRFEVRALNCTGLSVDADIDGSGDCIVNLADFAVMASAWLDCGWDDGGYNSPCP